MRYPSIAEVIGYIMLLVVVGGLIVALIMNSPDKGDIFIVPDPSVPEEAVPDKQSSVDHSFETKPARYPHGMWFHDGWKIITNG